MWERGTGHLWWSVLVVAAVLLFLVLLVGLFAGSDAPAMGAEEGEAELSYSLAQLDAMTGGGFE